MMAKLLRVYAAHCNTATHAIPIFDIDRKFLRNYYLIATEHE